MKKGPESEDPGPSRWSGERATDHSLADHRRLGLAQHVVLGGGRAQEHVRVAPGQIVVEAHRLRGVALDAVAGAHAALPGLQVVVAIAATRARVHARAPARRLDLAAARRVLPYDGGAGVAEDRRAILPVED